MITKNNLGWLCRNLGHPEIKQTFMSNSSDVDLRTLVPSDMDVPKTRLEKCTPNNLGWLCRNLGINNNDHPEIKQTLAKLNSLRMKFEFLARR